MELVFLELAEFGDADGDGVAGFGVGDGGPGVCAGDGEGGHCGGGVVGSVDVV